MKPHPLQQQFWQDEEEELADAVLPAALKIYFAGGLGGEMAMPPNVRALLSWDVFNQDAIAWLKKYKLDWLGKINETTRRQVVGVITDWVQSGKPMKALVKSIYDMGAFNKRRATQIAVTEVTRMYAEGNQAAWRATGMVGAKRWQTANDDKVCPICAPLHGMIVPLDGNGFTTEPGGEGITAPPAHVNCRCWLTPVVDADAVRQARLRRLGLING